MEIKSLALRNFRNFAKLDLTFHPKLTVFIGPNASGKTNICEAVILLSSGRSFRARTEVEMIMFDKQICHLGLLEGGGKREIKILKKDEGTVKHFFINGVPRSASQFLGGFYALYFGPWLIDFLFDSPAQRRYHIDMFLLQIDNEYYKNILSYNKILASRNRLLQRIKEKKAKVDELLFWDQKFVDLAAQIQAKRKSFFSQLESTTSDFSFLYLPSQTNREILAKKRREEINIGYSLFGPHRDDFRILKGRNNLLLFGSRGEQRLSILALILGELKFIEKLKEERPVLILDDIFSELDKNSKKKVFDYLVGLQAVITSTEKDVAGELGRERILIDLT